MKIGKIKSTLIAIGFLFGSNLIFAQTDSTAPAPAPEVTNSPTGGSQKFLLAGKAGITWQSGIPSVNNPALINSFNPISLMLMPLVKLNNRLFLDGQIEVGANPNPGGGAGININELILYYRVTPSLNVFFGNFSPKYGLYLGVLDDFTNRFCSSPVGMARGPQTQTGIGIQGGVQTGYSKINYQLYVSNGPQFQTDSANFGLQTYGNYTDNNKGKSIGGSFGWLPFSNSNLQLDVSGQYTAKSGDITTEFENISSFSWATDLNYYHVFSPVMLRVLAEYNYTQTDKHLVSSGDSVNTPFAYTNFSNQLSGWFVGSTLRASGSESTFLSNLELGARYGSYAPPKNAAWGGDPINQTTFVMTYWFTWKTPLNISYDLYRGAINQDVVTVRTIYFF